MTTIALFGAGGKMGYRLSTNFRGSDYTIRHVEVSEAGRERLKTGLGFDAVGADEALKGADVVILAVPDTHIGKVAASIESKLAAGTMVVVLDAGVNPSPFQILDAFFTDIDAVETLRLAASKTGKYEVHLDQNAFDAGRSVSGFHDHCQWCAGLERREPV